jgi:FkbM family methyltransferase
MLKRIAGRLPPRAQQELKRLHFARQIRTGAFTTAEAHETEFPRLGEWVSAGDWVIDVGANVGNYSARLSEIVGPTGRVISLEPVPETFELLVANLARFRWRNVTTLNVAASDRFAEREMTVPTLENGLANRYMARLSEGGGELKVLCMPVDALVMPHRVTLVKIDVEGHELAALRGMHHLLQRDHPTLIVEGRDDAVRAYLAGLGYGYAESERSPNRVFRCTESTAGVRC